MKSLFIDHSYHAKTNSSKWFIELLRKHSSSLDIMWDESWNGGPDVSVQKAITGDYDRIFVWQMEAPAKAIAAEIPDRLVFVPMYDGCYDASDERWNEFRNVRILSFCWELHARLRRLGLPSLHSQYFPNPDDFKVVGDFTSLRGFLWLRRPYMGWPMVRQLIANSNWSKFFVHNVPDPDPYLPMTVEASTVPEDDIRRFNVTVSGWLPEQSDFIEMTREANVFFAPRAREGIGMAFLEAMARGQCVVANHAPTHSEYITHNVSGMLFDIQNPASLDFSNVAELGRRAREKIENEYPLWRDDSENRVAEFLFGNGSDILKRGGILGDWRRNRPGRPAAAGLRNSSEGDLPLVTVAIVVRNAKDTFSDSFASVQAQNYPNLEIVVVDGGSTDGTLDLIRGREAAISKWISEPDEGTYDGMNKAARLARGKWILFMNASDFFYADDAISRAMKDAPADADFIIGHHVYRTVDGIDELHTANAFDDTWNALTSGNLSFRWLSGTPCHQATFTRTELLKTHGYDLAFEIAADHEFMYRMRSKGARFHHCDQIVAKYVGGGFSWQRLGDCVQEWKRVAKLYGPAEQVDRFFVTSFPEHVRTDRGMPELSHSIAGAFQKIKFWFGGLLGQAR